MVACVLAWVAGRYGFLTNIGDARDLWDAQVNLVQAIVAVALLVLAFTQSRTAIKQLELSRMEEHAEQLRESREQIQRLKDVKPIVFLEFMGQKGYQIVNAGEALAVNVWLVEEGKEPRSLGALQPRESRAFYGTSDRYLFVVEARPQSGRKFTPSMNIRTEDGNVCHGLLDPHNFESLNFDGELDGYLKLESTLLARFTAWQPGKTTER
jgi:hypothetical protein